MSPPSQLSVAAIRERLVGSHLPDDPTDVVFPPGSEDWPSGMRAALSASLKPAGVLIPVFERDAGLTVLLTRRSAALKHHASQISFPGGRMEPTDDDIEATALRETHEEVGISPSAISVLGYLAATPTVTGYAVTPVVGVVSPQSEIILDRTEVEMAFEVPLQFLLDPRNAVPSTREFQGRSIPIIEFRYEQHRIWGATAYMVMQLQEKLK